MFEVSDISLKDIIKDTSGTAGVEEMISPLQDCFFYHKVAILDVSDLNVICVPDSSLDVVADQSVREMCDSK